VLPSYGLFETDYWSHYLPALEKALFVREIQYFELAIQNATVTARVHSPISRGMRGYALDPENAKALRRKSEEMVGETFA
jgi:hypothetical protein